MLIKFSNIFGKVAEMQPDGSPYIWEVHNSPFMLLIASVEFTASNINKYKKMQFHNLAFRRKSVLDYKHYRRGGSKFWTYAPGLDFGYLIPSNKILLNTEHKGYSYVRILIEDVEFTLNVSGGCGGNQPGWTDYINSVAQLCGTRSLTKKHLNTLSSVAVNPNSCSSILINKHSPLNANDLDHFNQLLAKKIFPSKMKAGNKIVFGKGFSFQGAKELVFSHRDKHSFMCLSHSGWNVRVKSSQIDWILTGIFNEWNLPVIEDVNFCNQENSNVVCS